jgi:spermidine/putrescine transport system substrate-binding protein
MKQLLSIFGVFALVLLFANFLRNMNVTDTAKTKRKTLTIYAMSNYFPDSVLESFEKLQNCKIRYDNFSNNEELLAKLQAGVVGYDVIVPSDYTVRLLIAANLLSELDKSLIPNTKNIAPDFLNAPYDSDGKHTVPYSWGTTGLIYNKNLIKEPIDSWDVLFKDEYSGHISLLDDQREVMGALLKKLGHSDNTQNSNEVTQAKELLIKLKSKVRVFSSDPKQHLLSGDIWIAHAYSGDARQIIRTNPEFEFIMPKEGGVIWADTLAIPKGAKNVTLAHAFINHILDAQNARITAEELMYSSPNAVIESMVDIDFLKPSYLKKLPMDSLEYLEDLGAATTVWNQMWIEAKSY